MTGTAAFAAICVPQKDALEKDSVVAIALQTVYIGFASGTCVLAALTVCSAMFLNLVGAGQSRKRTFLVRCRTRLLCTLIPAAFFRVHFVVALCFVSM